MSPPILDDNQATQLLEHSLPSDQEGKMALTPSWSQFCSNEPSMSFCGGFFMLSTSRKNILASAVLLRGHFNVLRAFSQNLGSQWEKC